MPNRNMHEVMGHLGRDPEIQYTGTGTQFCKLSIATSNNYKDNHTGEWIERDPDWHRATVWGDLAEKVAVEFAKGDAIMVRGKSRTREYQGKDGQTRRITEVTASEIYKPVYVPKKGKQSRASDDEDIAFEDDFQEDVEIPF